MARSRVSFCPTEYWVGAEGAASLSRKLKQQLMSASELLLSTQEGGKVAVHGRQDKAMRLAPRPYTRSHSGAPKELDRNLGAISCSALTGDAAAIRRVGKQPGWRGPVLRHDRWHARNRGILLAGKPEPADWECGLHDSRAGDGGYTNHQGGLIGSFLFSQASAVRASISP